jgi:hypothetical protein
MKFEPRDDCIYRHDYVRFAQDVEAGKTDQRAAIREFILNDLWFIVYFVMRIPVANHPFWVNACREVADGPPDFTLDVWAREHGKSSIITIAETIQSILRNPEDACGIFSYVRPVAKKFLFSIKGLFQNERILYECFPDVVWQNCEKDAPLWSLDEGLILRRSGSRPEATVSAWGLIEGMPTGFHFERRIYDDIITEDIAESPEMMEKVKTKFDSSQNIGKEGGIHRVVGTYYHHNGPLKFIEGKTGLDGKPMYTRRFKPGSDDGTATGSPVFVSQKRWDELRMTRTFSCQQLLDPSPRSSQRLNPDYLKPVERKFIPKGLYRFMLVDPAGDLASNLEAKSSDAWAIGVVGVEPFVDDIGQSNVFIEDLWIEQATNSEGIEQIIRMYIRAGTIMKLGVEKVGVSTTHLHVQSALRAHGRHVRFDTQGGNGVILRPAGRHKSTMIDSALSWPLNNGKIHYSLAIPTSFIDRLKQEMSFFPVWHDDGINMIAYLYDLMKDFAFGMAEEVAEQEKRDRYKPKPPQRSWMSI